MNIYNQNDEFVKFNVDFLNGYLTSIALLRDYVTTEVGFNFYFKKIGHNKSLTEAINDEIKWVLDRYIGIDEVNELNSAPSRIVEIMNWQAELVMLLNFWIGEGLTKAIKEENRKWNHSYDLILKDFIEYLKLFFQGQEVKVYVFNEEFKTILPRQWGWLKCDDIIFATSNETYLLHFDLSD